MDTAKRDYYEALGVGRDADAQTIKDKFRALALEYHPDRNKSPGAEERFKEIAAAYAVLSDPEKRKAYDAGGFEGVSGWSEEELFRGVDFDDLFAGLGLHLRDFGWPGELGGGLFERFSGGRRPPRSRGRDLQVALVVPLSRVAQGGEEKLRFMRSAPCPECSSTGAKGGTRWHRCAACDGSGQRSEERRQRARQGEVLVRNITPCPECQARGTIIDEACPACSGRGTTEKEETLTVNVPVGVQEGMVLRIPQQGQAGPDPGSPSGDLLVIVQSAPDERWKRRGADLWYEDTLTVAQAALGTTRTIPSLEGNVEVTIPAGAQPGLVLRLQDKGLPVFGGQRRGQLYVRLDVRIPARLSPRERQLYEELRGLESSGAAIPPGPGVER